jgi:hypothetical protein
MVERGTREEGKRTKGERARTAVSGGSARGQRSAARGRRCSTSAPRWPSVRSPLRRSRARSPCVASPLPSAESIVCRVTLAHGGNDLAE